VPKLPAIYVHRVGRTARAGREGLSVALVTEHDVNLVHGLERKTRTRMDLYKHDQVTDDVVVDLLDEVSAAKVQAQVQVSEQFGERAQTLKTIASDRKTETNRLIRNKGESEATVAARKQRRLEDRAAASQRAPVAEAAVPAPTEQIPKASVKVSKSKRARSAE
jgi:ATP-dependent RNA helicase DDX49/DBP8